MLTQSAKTHVADDGNAVTFSALGGFGDLQGTSFDAEYLSQRTATPGTNGWTTHGINPRGGSQTFFAAVFGQVPAYVNGFTPDLSTGIYQSWRPLTDAPNVADVANLYRVTGLTGGTTAVQLMTDGVAPTPPIFPLFKLFLRPSFAGAARDLSHVVFESPLSLTADAPQGATSLYENADGVVRLVGRIPNAPDTTCDDVVGPACVAASSSQAGISATGLRYSDRMVSADGRRIYFQVPAGGESGAIYMREDGVRTIQLAQDGALGDASTDGSRAFFVTSERLVADDTDGNPDLYMYDANAPAGARYTLVSASSNNDASVTITVGASADGHYVYFVCDGQLVPGEPPADQSGLYVWHDGTLSYIGRFRDTIEALNGFRTEWDFPSTSRTARVTPDGRHLLFMAQSGVGFRGRGGFAGYDHAGHRELYLFSADTRRLVCASCNPSGRAATADALTDVHENTAVSAVSSKLSHALSDDGRRVFFTTAEALLPEDVNGVADAYEFDAVSGSVHLLSTGTDPSPSYFIDASNEGDDAFVLTRQRLVGWDVDDSYDLYDARVNGGFPEPAPPAPRCDGEGCLPQHATTPAGAVASDSFRGVGDVAGRGRRHRRCGRRAVLRKVRGKRRCVRRRSHRHAKRAELRDERSGR